MGFTYTPQLPSKEKKHDKYFDTSVVRVVLLSNQFKNTIFSDLASYSGKNLTSDHVKFEFKRAILVPIWELYWSLAETKNINAALINSSQAFGARMPKALVTILANMTLGVDVPRDVYRAQLMELGHKLDRDLDNLFQTIANKTKCNLGRLAFNIQTNFPENIKCKESCEVDKFFKRKKSLLKKVNEHNYVGYKLKDWHKQNTGLISKILSNFKEAKNSKNCVTLSDLLVFLYSKKTKTVILSLDNSFNAINSALDYDFHQISSVSASLGGTMTKVAQKAFEKSQETKN